MKIKDEVFEIFQEFHIGVERENNKLFKCLWINNGREYCSNDFKDYCNRFGIKHEKNIPDTPQQNGIAERMNHTIMEKVRSMLSNLGFEKHFLAKAMKTICYLINQSPTTTLDDSILKEVWAGKKENYSHLIFFGCEAFVHIPKEQRDKLDNKSMKCIFFMWMVSLVIIRGFRLNTKLLEVGM